MVRNSDPETRKVFANIFFRSGYHVLSAFFMALLLEKLIMLLGAYYFSYQIKLDYEYLHIIGDYKDWSQESVLIIYLFPYLILASLIVWLHLKCQNYNKKKTIYTKLFLYWIMFFSTYRILGMLPSHLIAGTGIYHAFAWLYMGITTEVILGIASFIVFFLIAIRFLHKIFYLYARINNNQEIIGLSPLLHSSFLFPVTLLFVIAILFFLPGLPKEEVLGLVAIAVPVIFTYLRLLIIKPFGHLPIDLTINSFKQWKKLVSALVIIVLIRIGLTFGIAIN